MANKITQCGKLLYSWLSSFATVYREKAPTAQQVEYPYILFTGEVGNFAEQYNVPLQVYNNRSTSNAAILRIADDIENTVGESGILIGDSELKIKIEKGSPFYQDLDTGLETIRAGYINLTITIY